MSHTKLVKLFVHWSYTILKAAIWKARRLCRVYLKTLGNRSYIALADMFVGRYKFYIANEKMKCEAF